MPNSSVTKEENGEISSYPLRLIPTTDKRYISNDNLNKDDFLGVWVKNDIELTDKDGKLNAGAIDIKRIPGFSTNKIPESISDDLNILINHDDIPYLSIWQEGEEGLLPLDDHFEIIDTRKHYFIRISDIDGFEGKYNNPPDKKDKLFNFNLSVVHKPLKVNYWHFEFAVFADGKEITNANSAWRNLICSSIRDRVQEVVKFEIA